eukprot:249832-Chlamydomonas_euryale.AAC.2
MLVSASGLGLSRPPRPQAGLGLGRRERPRPAASTNILCTDHPASVSCWGHSSAAAASATALPRRARARAASPCRPTSSSCSAAASADAAPRPLPPQPPLPPLPAQPGKIVSACRSRQADRPLAPVPAAAATASALCMRAPGALRMELPVEFARLRGGVGADRSLCTRRAGRPTEAKVGNWRSHWPLDCRAGELSPSPPPSLPPPRRDADRCNERISLGGGREMIRRGGRKGPGGRERRSERHSERAFRTACTSDLVIITIAVIDRKGCGAGVDAAAPTA